MIKHTPKLWGIIPVQCIICGKNNTLYRSLGKVIEQSLNPMVRFGYVQNVEELMSVSHLIVTKAGGLTVSEALTKHLPLVIFKPIPGQEEENAHFVQRIGAGHVVATEKVRSLLSHLLSNPKEVEKMREKATIALPGHSTERVVDNMLKLTVNSNEQKEG